MQAHLGPRRAVIFVALAAALAADVAQPAHAARVTDIIDSFERPQEDPVDLVVEATYAYSARRGHILREFRCLAHDQAVVGQFCPDGSRIEDARELDVERLRHVMNLKLRLGIWRSAEFWFELPLVILDQTRLTYAKGVTPLSSTVDPQGADPPPSLFGVPATGPERAGVGDPRFGVRLTPLSWARDPARATWALELGLTMPARPKGGVKQADNTSVGEGLWVIDLSTAVSARPIRQVEPYAGVGGTLRLPHSNSLFDDYGATQTLISPGHGINAFVGVEFHPYEDRGREAAFTIDVGGRLDYTFEGRNYTDLFDALGGSTCDARDSASPCTLTTYDRGDIDPSTGRPRKTDGITDVEQFGTLSTWLGVHYQPVRWVSLSARLDFAYEMPHFLTSADAGKDLDGRNQVQASNSSGVNEFNPVYDSHIDSLGSRFRTGGIRTVGFSLSLSGKF
ncbi:MAG: hypothetical protein H6744_13835 [Deltaproteobacteria bacterium]|nr:hypothetical protein [Deltaproteobacteria bacterium]